MNRTTTRAILLVALLFPGLGATVAQEPRARVVATPRFAFHSDFDTNLNDALIAAGLARRNRRPELFRAEPEATCFGGLAPSSRAGWDRAVDYYAEIISPTEWSDRQQLLLRFQLAGLTEELTDTTARPFLEIARGIRGAAAPAYRACRWAAQDEKNRRWIAEVRASLAVNEERVAAALEPLYQARWNGLPILIDVVETVNWSGANTYILRRGGHILMSSSAQGPAALELVFHEASHLLMGRNAPLRQALDSAARAANVPLPPDLWHVVLFYTTGEAVRRLLEAGGQPRYTPIVYDIFARGTWSQYRDALEGAWRPYVAGERPLAAAAANLIAAIPRTPLRNP